MRLFKATRLLMLLKIVTKFQQNNVGTVELQHGYNVTIYIAPH